MIRVKMLLLALAAMLFPMQAFSQYISPVGSMGGPSIGACGAGASIVAGSLDHMGTVNVGTGLVTTCSVNFSTTLVGNPKCLITSYGLATSPVMTAKTVSATGFSATFLLSIPGASLDYICYIN